MRLFGGWLHAQARLQRERYGVDLGALEGDEYAAAVRVNVTALIAELGEYLQERDWKPWKRRGRPENSTQLARGFIELVDCLHFMGNLLTLERLDDATLSQLYLDKMEENRARTDHAVHEALS